MFKANRLSVLLSGICALVLSMGIARYSFTPMIPYMQGQTEMTEALAGWLAGWNYIGYLVGLFIVWLVSDLRAKDFFYRYGLLITILATALMAAMDHPMVWYTSRFFTGVTSATGFMLGTGLIMNWLHQNGYKNELGIHFAGIGIGIVVSALVVELTGLDGALAWNWRMQWVALTLIGVLFMVPAMFLLPMPKAQDADLMKLDLEQSRAKEPSSKWLWLMQGAYFCAGFSNTVNATFTSLITELQPLDGLGTEIWMLVGVAAIFAPAVWDQIARRIGHLNALCIAFAVNALGNMVLDLSFNLSMTILSACLFGFTFMGIVSLTLTTIGRFYGQRATQVMARLTLGYCVAQIVSPIMSGLIAQNTGSFRPALHVITVILFAGLVCLYAARRESQHTETAATA